MAEPSSPVLLVTANVGSIFEDPSIMLKIWTEEFLNTISRLDPKFVALHCQEVGGKNYEESMKHVEYFVKLLMNSDELRLFDKVRVYLDEDYSSAENFTALGSFYFIHESISDVLIWDFKDLCFVAIEGKEVFAGDIEEISTKEKSKFPQDFFPECKWSRKGFMRTRWNLNGTVFDLVNIHLFHDASNFVAMETFPSVYSQTRQKALEYTLDRFHNDAFGPAPFFLFGDFNFRTDTQGVIKKLCEGLNEVKVNNGKNCKVQYKDSESQVVLTLGKKEFSHLEHQSVFIDDLWLKDYDKEMDEFCSQLFEFPIKFPPSYPFVEDSSVSCEYMPTRCPAWCDRVLLSQTARTLLSAVDDSEIEYGLIGKESCMGDHKPVYLKGPLLSGQGRLSCCETWLMHAPHAHSIPKVPTTIDETDSSSRSDVTFDVGDAGSDDAGMLGDEARVVVPGGRRLLSESSDIQHSTIVRSNTDTEGKRPLTERFIVKRVHSASIVEVKVGVLKQGSCKDYWRTRSVSVSAGGGRSLNWRHNSRVRLISKEDLKKSLPRLQSHHSSSDEDWFEEVDKQSLSVSKEPSVAVEPCVDCKSRKGRPCLTFKTRRKVHRHLSKSDSSKKCCTLS